MNLASATFSDFTSRYRLRAKRDPCGDRIIPGKLIAADMPKRVEYCNHIYDYHDGKHLAVCLLLLTKKRWTWAKRRLLAIGFELHQDGDTEGCLLFDPLDRKQARLAIRVCRIKSTRVLSEAQGVAGTAALEKAQAALKLKKAPRQGLVSSRKRPEDQGEERGGNASPSGGN